MIDMIKYIRAMIKDFPDTIGKVQCPWTEKLFKIDKMSKPLNYEKAKIFHTYTMKLMFLCKKERQDIQPAVAYLSTRTTKPNNNDWNKLVQVLSFLATTINDRMNFGSGR